MLWILYVNDILEDLESEVLLFADDTCIFASANDPTETAKIINRDLQKIGEWAVKWKVTFNPGKSKDMIFSKKSLFNSPPIIFNNTFVDRVSEHRHLGIWLSGNLSWEKQIKEVCLKANYKLSVLRSVKFLSRTTLDLLYKLTVRSIVDYGLTIYYHQLKQTELSRLNQIQYRAAKLCTGALHLTSQIKLESELGWESLSTRANFLGLCQFKKFHLHESRPLVLQCMPEINLTRCTRNKTFYRPFPPLGDKFSKSFFPYFTKQYNNLDLKLQIEHDLATFKENLKIKLKPKKYKHSISILAKLGFIGYASTDALSGN